MNFGGAESDAVHAGLVRYGFFFFAATGKGILVGLIAGACLLAADWLTGVYFHDSSYYANHGWPKLAAFAAAALLIWMLNSGSADETVPGSELHEGRKPFFTRKDTLFFAPAQYWPWILLGLGLLFYFV
ncbi:MAG: hypothetical protein KGN79_14680 [Acidobacteriota bacterium]|nr:hypothetical protein [Acidobacteriota bacterium]